MQFKQIKSLRDKGLTYKEIGDKAGVSSEYIRQLFSQGEVKTCAVHKIKYTTQCDSWVIESDYLPAIQEMTYEQIHKEAEKLSVRNNSKKMSLYRKAIVKFMYENLRLSFSFIGKLMKRDHTTIMHLYENS